MTKNILKVALIGLAMFSLFSISWAMGQLQSGTELVGQKAIAFSLEDSDGNKVDTSGFIGKRPVIFFFWTTWCPHCRRQINHLKAEAENIKNAGAELILVNVDESQAQVASFLKSSGIPFSSLLDKDGKVAESYKIIGVPTFVIVGGDGIIKFHDNLLPEDYQKILLGK